MSSAVAVASKRYTADVMPARPDGVDVVDGCAEVVPRLAVGFSPNQHHLREVHEGNVEKAVVREAGQQGFAFRGEVIEPQRLRSSLAPPTMPSNQFQ